MIQLQQIGSDALDRYASVSIAFKVTSRLRVEPVDSGLGGIRLIHEGVDPAYIKDYDVDERPTDWPKMFDVSRWTFFLACTEDGFPVGAATVAYDTPGVHMLDDRRDLTVLWDLRVHPDFRGQGIGRRLFQAAEDWSRSRPTTVHQMKIETQNINVNACRFYARQGAVLGAISRFAYVPRYAGETMLLWFKDL